VAEPPELQPADLTKEELLRIVEQVRDTLWPRGAEDDPWTPDTINAVASSLEQYNLRPRVPDTSVPITALAVRERVEIIRELAETDPEVAASQERNLWAGVLEGIQHGSCVDPSGCAQAALHTRTFTFRRY